MYSDSPWYKLYDFTPPNFPFCGEFVPSWNVDPIDTYSSIIYLILSFIIFKKSQASGKLLRFFSLVPTVLFFGSILFHMTFTFEFLIADFLGIFFLNFYGNGLNLIRLKKIEIEYMRLKAVLLTILWAILMWITNKYKIHNGLNMAPIVLYFLWTEFRCYSVSDKLIDYGPFKKAIAFLGVGYVFMLLEGIPFRLGCTEGMLYGKLQLHTIWHLFSAISIYYIFSFYNQKNIREKLI